MADRVCSSTVAIRVVSQAISCVTLSKSPHHAEINGELGCSSVEEHLSSMQEALGSISSKNKILKNGTTTARLVLLAPRRALQKKQHCIMLHMCRVLVRLLTGMNGTTQSTPSVREYWAAVVQGLQLAGSISPA